MTKYDWSNVPKEVKWIATDSDGWGWGWIEKPAPRIEGEWLSIAGFDGIYCEFYLKPESNRFQGNWKDSLEERPNEFN